MREEARAVGWRPVLVRWYASPAELAGDADLCARRRCDAGWAGETWDEALEGARRGRTGLVPDAEALLERVRQEVESPASVWAPARAGAYPVVPDALAGLPEPMRRRVPAQDSRAPVRVLVDLTSSGGLEHGLLARRGVAFLALAMALSVERPLELYVVVALGGGRRDVVLVAELPTRPLDLAAACHALTSQGYVRGLCYSLCRELGSGGEWAFSVTPDGARGRAAYAARLSEALGATEDDLVVPPAYLEDEAARDPVGFVRRAVDARRAAREL